jgi:hypothetical protein
MTGVAAILAKLLKHYGLEGCVLECSLRRHWKNIVGEAISSHTVPIRIESRRLHLWVDSFSWADQLNHLKPLLLEKINTCFSTRIFKDILIKTGPPPLVPPDPPQPVKDADPRPSTEDVALRSALEPFLQEYLKSVGDQKLKEVLERVMIKSLTCERSLN